MSWPCDMISAEAIAKVERKEIFKALYEAADERYKAFVSDMGMAARVRPYPEDFDALIRDFPLIEFLKFIDTALSDIVNNYVPVYLHLPPWYASPPYATLLNSLEIEGWLENGKHELIESGWGGPGNRLLEWVMQRYIWITSMIVTIYSAIKPIGAWIGDDQGDGFLGNDRWKFTPFEGRLWPKGEASLLMKDVTHEDIFVTGMVNTKSDLIVDWIFYGGETHNVSGSGPLLDGWEYPRQRPITP